MSAKKSDRIYRGLFNDANAAGNPEWDALAVTATTESTWIPVNKYDTAAKASFQVKMVGDLSGSIKIQGTNFPDESAVDPVDLGTPTTLSGSDAQHDEAIDKDYAFMRAVITVSGGTSGDITGGWQAGNKQ